MLQNQLNNQFKNENNPCFAFFEFLKNEFLPLQNKSSSFHQLQSVTQDLLSLTPLPISIQNPILDNAYTMRQRATSIFTNFLKNIKNIQTVSTRESLDSSTIDITRQRFRLMNTEHGHPQLLTPEAQNATQTLNNDGHPQFTYQNIAALKTDLRLSLNLADTLINFLTQHCNQAGLTQWPGFLLSTINLQEYMFDKGQIINENILITIRSHNSKKNLFQKSKKNTTITLSVKFTSYVKLYGTGESMYLPPFIYQYELEGPDLSSNKEFFLTNPCTSEQINQGSNLVKINDVAAFFDFSGGANRTDRFYLTHMNEQNNWKASLKADLLQKPADGQEIYLFVIAMFVEVFADPKTISDGPNTIEQINTPSNPRKFMFNSQYKLYRPKIKNWKIKKNNNNNF